MIFSPAGDRFPNRRYISPFPFKGKVRTGWPRAMGMGYEVLGQTNKFIRTRKLQRSLRKDMTIAERKLWSALRLGQMNGHKFRRQHPFENYILDFVCLEEKLVIEVDGSQHFEQINKDEVRTKILEKAGFRVMRFWNNQVMNEFENVKEAIFLAVETHPHPSLPLEGEGTIVKEM